MRRNRLLILWAAAVALVLGICLVLQNRPRAWQTIGALRSSDLREIQRAISLERLKRVVRGIRALDFGPAFLHLQEKLSGRIRIVTSAGADEANVEIREQAETGRRWNYQLERQSSGSGWKVIGVGYRSALIIRPITQPGSTNRSQATSSQTNTTVDEASSGR